MHADDGFDPVRVPAEVRYFHCPGECTLTLPVGRGADHRVARPGTHARRRRSIDVRANGPNVANLSLQPLRLPDWAPRPVTADLHVHMNYGGHYRNTEENLIEQARAEDLDVIYNLIVNKEQRIPDIALLRRGAAPRCERHHRVPQSGVSHQLLGPSRPAAPRALPHAGLQRLSAQRADLAVSAQRCHRRPGARAGRTRRLRASVRHGARARARVADECDARRRRARQGRLHRSRRLRRPQGDGGSLVQAAERRLPRADRLRHRCDGELCEPARARSA